MELTAETRISIGDLFHENRKFAAQTVRAFKTLHKHRQDPFLISTVTRIIENIKAAGSVLHAPRSGRPSVSEDVDEIKDANTNEERIKTGCLSAHDIAKSFDELFLLTVLAMICHISRLFVKLTDTCLLVISTSLKMIS